MYELQKSVKRKVCCHAQIMKSLWWKFTKSSENSKDKCQNTKHDTEGSTGNTKMSRRTLKRSRGRLGGICSVGRSRNASEGTGLRRSRDTGYEAGLRRARWASSLDNENFNGLAVLDHGAKIMETCWLLVCI